MFQWSDAKKTAMQTEEAALLPAMIPDRPGRAALASVMRKSGKMAGMLTAAVPEEKKEENKQSRKKTPGRLIGRAALRQVWKGHYEIGR